MADSSSAPTFSAAPDRCAFPAQEQEILKFWEEIDAFQTQLKKSEGKPAFTFYDGPPFATGLPHYGHILAGTIKDVVTRYAAQTGHYVERRFGWDTHGLPIEFEIDKKFEIKGREDVMKMGIKAYNAECRKIVMKFSSEWEKTVTRMGRWIDFKNDYKTMDPSYMESVWWVFGQLWEKGLVYQGHKVMPYSTGLTTPLSNFEANLNYKEVQDPACTIAFKAVDDADNASFLAWTTTPWTLVSNLALCVNPTMDYVKIKDKDTGDVYILAKTRLVQLYKKPKAGKHYELLSEFKGETLRGKRYEPLFPYFEKYAAAGAFRVLVDDYVTSDAGTGIVHNAPGFGEDDYRVCKVAGIVAPGQELVCPVDESGRYTSDVPDYQGKYVKDADREILKNLKARGQLIRDSQCKHDYPFCWRSETPLIYRAIPTWFINVTKIKERLVENNTKTQWVPSFVKEKRFHNWLKDARDWCVSRNRYWGCTIPIWMSSDGKEKVCVKSVEHLFELSGVRVSDLHKDVVDDITIPDPRGADFPPLKRIPEVFDCWFESGSMPYAQQHYPFENKEKFENGFPADFIAEGLDQTRGWFYTLMVLSTALFDKPAFKNVIVNGLVLASNGKKMSKRLQNYPPPTDIIDLYSADALRLYLINSPVVRAEPLKFSDAGVKDVVKDVFLPWQNAYRFFIQEATRFERTTQTQFRPADKDIFGDATENVMDTWILSSLQTLVRFVRKEMEQYRLYTVVPRLLTFINDLTNWYVRLNRSRMRGQEGQDEAARSLQTMWRVLYDLCRLMAPFTPFLVEAMYRNLSKCVPNAEASVHFLDVPSVVESALRPDVERAVAAMRSVIDLGRKAREQRNLSLKKPLKEMRVVHQEDAFLNDVRGLDNYVKSELFLQNVEYSSELKTFVKVRAEPVMKLLGKRLGKQARAASQAIRALSHDEVLSLSSAGSVSVCDGAHEIQANEIQVIWEFQGDQERYASKSDDTVLCVLDTAQDEALRKLGLAREFCNRVQQLRKTQGLKPTDKIVVWYRGGPLIESAAQDQAQYIKQVVRIQVQHADLQPANAELVAEETTEVDGEQLSITFTKPDLRQE